MKKLKSGKRNERPKKEKRNNRPEKNVGIEFSASA